MSSASWSQLPALPLQFVLQNLSLEDALAATSTCRTWRNAIYMYEGQRDILQLRAKELQKNIFLARLFRKNAKKLHLYLDGRCEDLSAFIHEVLPMFFDVASFEEIAFIGRGYNRLEAPVIRKLKSPVTAELVAIHRHSLRRLLFLDCSMTEQLIEDSENKIMNTNGGTKEDRPLLSKSNYKRQPFSCLHAEEDISKDDLSKRYNFDNDNFLGIKSNLNTLAFISLKYLCLDYYSVDAEALRSFDHLPSLEELSLNVVNKNGYHFERLPWHLLQNGSSQVQVSLNIISLPLYKFKEVMEKILVEDLPLVAIRVLFCKILHDSLIRLLCHNYRHTLREFQWVDSHMNKTSKQIQPEIILLQDLENNINPLVFLCWQCLYLQKFVVHGYWICQYDLLGMVRLRNTTLRHLEVSALVIETSTNLIPAVTLGEKESHVGSKFVQQINQYLLFHWCPIKRWRSLHRALRSEPKESHRLDYIMTKILKPLGVT